MSRSESSPACMEASPAELLAVAKHLWREGMSHRDAVGHAYQLICEARLLSTHLQHLNRRLQDPIQTSIRDLVWQSARNAHGQPLRVPLLVSLMKSLGRGTTPTMPPSASTNGSGKPCGRKASSR